MSTDSSSDNIDALTEKNLESLLQEDEGFVDFFNNFLALPCFAERLHYNTELGVFEEFIEKLADDVGKGDAKAASQLRQFTHFKGTIYNVAANQSRIGYYVTVLDKVQGLEFVKKHRLHLFLRSELYAEYKLTKHLSTVQESFFRDLHPESSEDDDSGVEEAAVFHPAGRRRSVVSFNLTPSLGEAPSPDTDRDAENEGIMYLPTNVRSIEETFDAWHESFKRTESRASMFSSGDGSYRKLNTPQIMEEDEASATRSTSSCFSTKESESSASNNARPVSGLSIASDNTEKGLSPAEPSSRISSASTVSFFLENQSSFVLNQEESNACDLDSESRGNRLGADEMTRSLSSALSFITEHGKVIGNSSAPGSIIGETDLGEQEDAARKEDNTSEKDFVVEEAGIAGREGISSREEAERESVPPGEKDSVVEFEKFAEHKNSCFKEGIEENLAKTERDGYPLECESLTGSSTVENTTPDGTRSEMGMGNSESDVIKEPLTPDLGAQRKSGNEDARESLDEEQVPSIDIEVTCSDEEETLDKETALNDDAVDLNSVADSNSGENCGSVAARVELSLNTEDIFIIKEKASVSNAPDYTGQVDDNLGGNDEKRNSSRTQRDVGKPTVSDEDCLHCKNAKRKNVSPTLDLDASLGERSTSSKEELKKVNLSNVGSDPGEIGSVDEYSGHRSAQSGSIAEEISNTGISALSEVDVDSENNNKETSFQGRENDDTEMATGEIESKKQDLQGEEPSPGKDSDDDDDDDDREDDDEAGYTTEASATTLQGIRGIFGSRRRSSLAATSVGFDAGDDSMFSDDGSELDDKPYDLATKEGFDMFREFLLETSGEKLLQFWLEVECGKYLENEDERNRLVQSLRDRFWRSGGIYEFSAVTKSRLNLVDASTLTFERLFSIQPDVLRPLLSYWCIRFTMHQQRVSHSHDQDYNTMSQDRLKSCFRREITSSNLPQVPAHVGLSQVLANKTLARPQSSFVKNRPVTQHQTSRPQVRAKSAHPRLLQANKYMHTNASTTQLQNIIAPVRTGYGFEQPPGPSFPVEPEPDYAPSVRLFINPVPSPDSKIQRMMRTLHRTSIYVEGSKPALARETGSKTAAMMDALIQGLIYERQTGDYFKLFLQKSGNETWMNCLAFWKSLQEYNAYFFADSLNPSLLSRKARTMYANFVVSGSAQDVHVHRDIQVQVHKELEPPYEELFDAVEEHVLHSLLEPWQLHLEQEKSLFDAEVPKQQTLRHIEIQVVAKRRQSIISTRRGLDPAEEDHEKERISVEEANRPFPVPKDGITFESLIRNRDEVEYFKEFLNKKHNRGIKDLMAWTDMETFRRVPRFMEEKRDKKAREIRENWLGKKYFFGADSPATRDGQNLIMNINGGRPIKERPQSPVILESQKFVRARIERRWLMLFKQTAEFLERQKPRAVSVPEMVEDIMLKRRLQRSEAAWKILNSRWVSSSRDVVALRQTLLNPSLAAEFTAFVAMKGDTLESNVQFWLEVQKFKDLCHAHAQQALIQRKIQTIIDCFLNSAIAPELQIDIPIEMADKLMERLSGRNPSIHPYVFREAQMTVFRVLFNHWKEFITHRSKIPEGEDPREHFAEMLRRHRADNKSKKEASERRRLARLSAERKKKEKEEREKKRIEDLSSLFSMDTGSYFYSEEDDLRSWSYSKHLVEQERQEHIKRLREQGIIVPEEELVEEKEETKSRRSRVSMTKSSTFGKKVHDTASDKKSSEGSSRRLQVKLGNLKKHTHGQMSPSLARRGSAVSTVVSITRRNSGVSLALSRKDEKMSVATVSKDDKGVEKGEEKVTVLKDTQEEKINQGKSSEIQVIHIASPETPQPHNEGKLLPQRSRSSRRLLPGKQPPKSAGKKRVPLDAISCISDYSVLSNIEFQPRVTPLGKDGQQGGTSLLTSKSLKDFTNSPEGAQLSMPLPLVRITSASHLEKSDTDGSIGDPSPLYYKPRPMTQSLKKSPTRPGRRKGLGLTKEEMQIKPDVIVN